MSNPDQLLLVAAVTSSIVTIIGAIFAGWIALKQIPEVHKLVNSTATEQAAIVAALHAEVAILKDLALAKAEAREATSPSELK